MTRRVVSRDDDALAIPATVVAAGSLVGVTGRISTGGPPNEPGWPLCVRARLLGHVLVGTLPKSVHIASTCAGAGQA